jgi:hypothetical protein
VKVKKKLNIQFIFLKKQNRNLLYSWLPTEIDHKNWAIAIFKIKNFQNFGEFGSFFFFQMENPLYRSKKSYFSG